MSFDHWKTTNPDDEWLGPEPDQDEHLPRPQIPPPLPLDTPDFDDEVPF